MTAFLGCKTKLARSLDNLDFNRPCVLPFNYTADIQFDDERVEYDGCMLGHDGKYFCATEVDDNGFMKIKQGDGNIGECNDDCPKDKSNNWIKLF